MFTSDDGARGARRLIGRGFIPALMTGHVCAMAADAPSQAQALLDITGRLTAEGAECQAMRGEDGQLYTLIGMEGAQQAGTRIRVTGERVDPSPCQQGTTIRVKTIQQTE